MHFMYGMIQCGEKNKKIQMDDYQYWILLSGHGHIISEKNQYTFESHEMMEFPQRSVITVAASDSMLIGTLTLEDFNAANTKIRHYPAHMTDLIRKSFYYGLELCGTRHPYKKRILQNLDQIMADIIFSLPHAMLADSPVLFSVITQINEHYEDPDLQIGEILKNSSYSPAYIRRLFLKETGLSPNDYMNNLRIEKAKKLLAYNKHELSVSDISEQCGFKDPFYFSRLFKKNTGETPSEYRKKVFTSVNHLSDDFPG